MVPPRVLTKKKFAAIGLVAIISLSNVCNAIICRDGQTDVTDCKYCPEPGKLSCGNHCAESCEDCGWKGKCKENPNSTWNCSERFCGGTKCEFKRNDTTEASGQCQKKAPVVCKSHPKEIVQRIFKEEEELCNTCRTCDTSLSHSDKSECEKMVNKRNCIKFDTGGTEKAAYESTYKQPCKPKRAGVTRSAPIYLKPDIEGGDMGFWWYQSLTPLTQKDNTFFQIVGSEKGYAGIQQFSSITSAPKGEGKGCIIMSMGDHGKSTDSDFVAAKILIDIDDNPPSIFLEPDLLKGETEGDRTKSKCGPFEGEGLGIRCRLFVQDIFPEKDMKYHFVYHCIDSLGLYMKKKGLTQCSMYYYLKSEKKWFLHARLEGKKPAKYNSFNNFIENWSAVTLGRDPEDDHRAAKIDAPYLSKVNKLGANGAFEKAERATFRPLLSWNFKEVNYEAKKNGSITISSGYKKNNSLEPKNWCFDNLDYGGDEFDLPEELILFKTKMNCLQKYDQSSGDAARFYINICLEESSSLRASSSMRADVI